MKTLASLLAVATIAMATSLPTFADETSSASDCPATISVKNINSDELRRCCHISKKSAEAVATYGKEHPFQSKEDLVQVPGLTKKTISKLQACVA